MKANMNFYFIRHIKDNFKYYFISLLFFTTGIAAGAFTVKALSLEQKQELILYFNKFLQILSKENIDSNSVLFQTLKNNLATVLIFWFLGITVIGVPVIMFVVSFKGFIVGFTVSFLIEGLGWKGIILSIISILPPNVIYIPCIVVLSVLSMTFSMSIIRKKLKKGPAIGVKTNFSSYSITFIILFLLMCLGSFLEAYVSPALLKSISGYIIN